MSYLLPDKKEILPITESWSTFYESGFNESFDKMPFKSRLQIINDIIRQTILYDEFPNPQDEEINLIGDSYTSSKVLINYLKKLNLGKNHRIVMTQNHIFEPNATYTTHFITLLEENGITYQVDCTPSTGYKCGQVEDIKTNKFYNNYLELNKETEEQLRIIRGILYRINYETVNDSIIKKYVDILNDFPMNDILTGYIYKCFNCLYNSTKEEQLRQNILNKYLCYQRKERYVKNGIVFASADAFEQIKTLKAELEILIIDDNNYRRQLEIAQCIIAELIKYNKHFDKKLEINNKKISFTNINPRLFLEAGLNVILLKPSSFKSETSEIIKQKYLDNEQHIIGEYFPNLGAPSVTLGLKPMRFFHPFGYKYERSMYGPGDLFLVKQKAADIKSIKKELRDNLARNFHNTKLTWYDGEEIVWDPVILNLVHTTDDPSEASLHYLADYPEYQLMTRFMYPNPKLKILEKEK